MPRVPTAALAGGSLVAGFAVAELTGVRALGGAVLVAGVALCWPRWRRAAGTGTAVALVATYGTGFVLSHVIAPTVGAWPAVLLVASAVAASSWLAADRRQPRDVPQPAAR